MASTPAAPGSRREWLGQATRFAAVGIATNAVLYLAFLGLLRLGWTPQPAMSVTFVAGVLLGFAGHRRWSFGQRGPGAARALRRYAIAYCACYALNTVVLAWLVGGLGLPAAWVQAGAVVLNAALLFLLQKFWIFRPDRDAAQRS